MAVYHEDVHAVLSFKNTKHVLERALMGGSQDAYNMLEEEN